MPPADLPEDPHSDDADEPGLAPPEGVTAWRALSGIPDLPAYPNALAWSAHNELAIACSRKVFVLQARAPFSREMIHADVVLAADDDLAPGLTSSTKHRTKPADTANFQQICPPQLSEACFRAVSWSPPLPGVPPRCLLAASIAHRTGIYCGPSPLQNEWRCSLDLTPILAGAITAAQPATGGGGGDTGDGGPDSGQASRRSTEIHSSSWSAAFTLRAPADSHVAALSLGAHASSSGGTSSRGPTASTAAAGPSRICTTVVLLALAGPEVICVIVHESDEGGEALAACGNSSSCGTEGPLGAPAAPPPAAASSSSHAASHRVSTRCGVGALLRCGKTTQATCVAFVPWRTGVSLASADAHGAVYLWSISYARGAGGVGTVAASVAAAVLDPDWRPVHSLASVVLGEHTGSDEDEAESASDCDGRPASCDGDTVLGGAVEGGGGGSGLQLVMAVGRGCTVSILSLFATGRPGSPPRDAIGGAFGSLPGTQRATGAPGGTPGEAAVGGVTASPVPSHALVAPLWHVSLLAEACHTHQVSAVCISRHSWLSVSIDGTALVGAQHARLPLPAWAAAQGGEAAGAQRLASETGVATDSPSLSGTRSLELLQGSVVLHQDAQQVDRRGAPATCGRTCAPTHVRAGARTPRRAHARSGRRMSWQCPCSPLGFPTAHRLWASCCARRISPHPALPIPLCNAHPTTSALAQLSMRRTRRRRGSPPRVWAWRQRPLAAPSVCCSEA